MSSTFQCLEIYPGIEFQVCLDQSSRGIIFRQRIAETFISDVLLLESNLLYRLKVYLHPCCSSPILITYTQIYLSAAVIYI